MPEIREADKFPANSVASRYITEDTVSRGRKQNFLPSSIPD
jgi:hypothetical protein